MTVRTLNGGWGESPAHLFCHHTGGNVEVYHEMCEWFRRTYPNGRESVMRRLANAAQYYYQKYVGQLERKYAIIVDELQLAKEQIKQLKDEKSVLATQAIIAINYSTCPAETDADVSEMKARIRAVELQRDAVFDRMKVVETQRNTSKMWHELLMSQIVELEDELEQARKTIATQGDEINTYREKKIADGALLTETVNRCDQLYKENCCLRESVSRLSSGKVDKGYQDECTTLRVHLIDEKQAHEKTRQELARVRTTLKNWEYSFKYSTTPPSTIAALAARVTALQAQLHTEQVTHDKTREELAAVKRAHETTQKELARVRASLVERKSWEFGLIYGATPQSTINMLSNRVSELQQQLYTAQLVHDKTRDELDDAQNEVLRWKTLCTNWHATACASSSAMATARKDVSVLKDTLSISLKHARGIIPSCMHEWLTSIERRLNDFNI